MVTPPKKKKKKRPVEPSPSSEPRSEPSGEHESAHGHAEEPEENQKEEKAESSAEPEPDDGGASEPEPAKREPLKKRKKGDAGFAKESKKKALKREGTTEWPTKVAASVSLMAVVFIAVMVNILAARHYRRWDFTKGGEFTLSPGTIDTLHGLNEPIHIIVLLSRGTPTGVSLAEILDGYKQYTDKLDVEFVDPDSDQARMIELEKKYNLIAGESAGHVVTDAAMIVIQGDRHRYVQGGELMVVEDPSDMRTRPRLEYAITSAIRHVRASEPPVLCFTTGHGELPLENGDLAGMAELKDRLQKNNYEVTTVFDPTADAPKDPLKPCALLVVATPRAPIPKDHLETMKQYIEDGGSALLVVGPWPNAAQDGWVATGIDEVVGLAGVKLMNDYVHERDPSAMPRGSDGTEYYPTVRPHPVTERLLRVDGGGGVLSVQLKLTSALGDLGGNAKPEPLLMSSPKSLGIVNYWQRFTELVETPDDHPGPLTIATATELPPKAGKERGSRIVVISASSIMLGANWSDATLAGNALFVEGAFSWLVSHEQFLDIPDKPIKNTGVKITQEATTSLFRYIVIFIPAAVTVVGLLIFWMRRRRPAALADEEVTS